MSVALQPEILEKAWNSLDDEAKAYGERHAQRLVTYLGQGSLFHVDDLRETFIRREAEANPGKLVVTSEVFEDFRFRAGIAASLIDDATVRRANWSVMWDRILESTAGVGSYDLGTRSFTLAEAEAAAIFARDYEWTASARLMGDRLIEFDSEGEQ